MGKKAAVMVLIGMLMSTFPAFGNPTMPPDVKKAIEQSGFPIYPGAIYCMGAPKSGVRFATKDSPDAVRKWYVEHLPKWSVMDEFGLWMLYEGPPGKGMEAMAHTNVVVQKNEKLPSWHSLPKDTTTEILVIFPNG